MVRHRFFLWAWTSSATLVGLAVSIAAAQDLFQGVEEPAAVSSGTAGAKTSSKDAEPEFIRKTAEEWQKLLSPAEYMVTRLKATEPAFTGKYATGHYRGMFACVCCGAELFNAQHKF